MSQQHMNDPVQHFHAGTIESVVHPLHHVGKAKERLIYTNKFTQAFNSLSLGSQQIPLVIPNQQVITGIYANMTFKGSNAADTLAPMAAYQAIHQVQYRVMGSTLYSLTGRDLWQIVRNMCYTKDQVDELISLAGGPVANNIGVTNLQTSIWIPMPWSKLNALASKIRYGVDTSIFQTQQIQIFIDLESADKIYTVNTGANSSLVSAQYRVYGGEYLDKENRINLKSKDEFFAFPSTYWQSFGTSSFTPANASDVISQQLLSFRKGNLTGIIMYAIDDANVNGLNKFKLNEIQNANVKFNGVTVYQEFGGDGRLCNLQHNITPAHYVAYSQTNRVKELVFCNTAPRLKQYMFQGGLQLSGQTLTVDFTISNSTNPQKLYVIYMYDALWMYNHESAELVL